MSCVYSVLRSGDEMRMKYDRHHRQYVETNYLAMKAGNPTTPILVRPAVGTQSFAVARYEMGKEQRIELEGADVTAVESAVANLTA